MASMLLLVALAASFPTTTPQAICESARTAALPEDRAGAYESCIHDEQAARDQLKQKWRQYSPAALADCSGRDAVPASYVEVLTCLEMQNGGKFGVDAGQQPAIVSAPAPSVKSEPPKARDPKP